MSVASSSSQVSGTGRRVIVVMGVTGCGKSTLGIEIARCLKAPFLEGDEFHPPANIEKMSAGIPLDDADRAGWLDILAAEIGRLAQVDGSVVASCSALKHKYRTQLNSVSGQNILYVFVDGPREVIAERLGKRKGHYMPSSLLDSQLAALEPPGGDENVIRVDLRNSIADMLADVMNHLKETVAAT